MKIQIRSNVFETNSSSMHSIAVSKVNGKYTDEEVYESFKYYDKHYGRKEDLHIQFLYVIFISSDRIFEDLISSGIINAKFIKEYADEYSMEEE